ncbi:MAG TPA: SPOR domain-containing protein [Acidobacteriaceae bacterium]|nr:SPOR domain-containing protein [Acidobacteriaceae bacterium]
MSRLLDDEQDDLPERERELTLSAGAILAIFLGLVLLCAVFFGFGYNLGRKSTTVSNAPLPAATHDTEPAGTGGSTFDNFKPSPSSPSGSTPAVSTTSPPVQTSAVSTSAPANTTETRHVPIPVHAAPAPTPATPSASPSTPARASQLPAIAPGGAFVVQIAAISGSHKDDADLLMNALHGKGYQVSERTEAQDKLIHIQVGPFATKAEAEAMRERLIVDGYNAIVK